jgi:hypothetical protein
MSPKLLVRPKTKTMRTIAKTIGHISIFGDTMRPWTKSAKAIKIERPECLILK